MTTKRKITAAVGLPVLACVLSAGPAGAFNPQPEPPPGSLPVGITATQVAVVNVVYPPGSEVGGISPQPFAVGIGFYDANGRLVANVVEDVALGHVVSLRLSGREIGLRGANRGMIYGVVQCLGEVARKVQCAQSIGASMEVFDAENRRTQLAVPLVPSILPVLGIDPTPF